MDTLKKKLNERGPKGIMGLMKNFRQVDKDNSNTLIFEEFKLAMKDYKLPFDGGEFEVLFKEFDKNKDSTIRQDEFIKALRVFIIILYYF